MNWKKISDIIYDPISGEWGEEGHGIKVIRTTNFTNEGKLNLTDIVSRNVDQKKVEKKRLINGDIIIEKSGGSPTQPVGRVVYFDVNDSEFICNNFTSVLRLKDNEFDSRYFFWFLFWQHQSKKTLRFQNKTTGIINLQLSRYLDEIKVKSISLKAQKHIAEILDKADALRQQNRQLLAHYDELLQSTFIELFGDPVKNPKGWEVKRLGDICNKITDGTHKTPSYQSSGVKFISAKNIKNGEIDWNDLKYISEEEHYQLFKRCNPEYGDILITKSGSIGMSAIVKENNEFSLFESLALVKLKEQIVNYFFRELINSNNLVHQFIKGVGVKHLHLTDLRNLQIPVPPLHLQQRFAKIVEQIETQKDQAKITLAESEALFEGLLAKYFN